MSLPRYPKYKQSGVEWLREVPLHWDVRRLRFVVMLNPTKAEVATLDRATSVSFLPMESIGDDGTLKLDMERALGEVEAGYTYLRDGDVAVAKITPCFENGKGALMRGLTNGIGFGTTELIVARPIAGRVTGMYLHFLFTSQAFRDLGASYMYGAGGQKRVPEAFARNFTTAFPPLSEQSLIVAFLERETAKIDELVEEQRRLIALLQEKRQAIITHAVTKGLNPNSPLKPSGFTWIGDTPSHWLVGNIRRFATMKTGHTPSRSEESYWQVCDIPWFTLADVWQLRDGRRTYLGETKEMISEAGLRNSAAELLPTGTVVFSRTASVGFSGIMPKPMATSQDFWNWIPGKALLPEFLLYNFRSMRQEFARLTMGSTHQTIYQPDAAALSIVVPPVNEQRAIIDVLATHTEDIDTLTDEAEHAIRLLLERRVALISAAVTGRVDVRAIATPEAA